jgi:hypothetical protein
MKKVTLDLAPLLKYLGTTQALRPTIANRHCCLVVRPEFCGASNGATDAKHPTALKIITGFSSDIDPSVYKRRKKVHKGVGKREKKRCF